MGGNNLKTIINSVAPIRVCDNGGWTDTWFAEYGKVFNIGVYPYAEVQIEVFPYDGQEERVVIFAENFGERYAINPQSRDWDRHPLLEAAIEMMGCRTIWRFRLRFSQKRRAGHPPGHPPP
jgi:hypothetical protein